MAKLKIGSNAQFTTVGKTLTVIGAHCYAYSGSFTITSGGYTPGLDFATGKGYILAELQITSVNETSTDLYYKVTINGIDVLDKFVKNPNTSDPMGFAPIQLLLPPNSSVQVAGQRGSGSDFDIFVLLTGTLYV